MFWWVNSRSFLDTFASLPQLASSIYILFLEVRLLLLPSSVLGAKAILYSHLDIRSISFDPSDGRHPNSFARITRNTQTGLNSNKLEPKSVIKPLGTKHSTALRSQPANEPANWRGIIGEHWRKVRWIALGLFIAKKGKTILAPYGKTGLELFYF